MDKLKYVHLWYNSGYCACLKPNCYRRNAPKSYWFLSCRSLFAHMNVYMCPITFDMLHFPSVYPPLLLTILFAVYLHFSVYFAFGDLPPVLLATSPFAVYIPPFCCLPTLFLATYPLTVYLSSCCLLPLLMSTSFSCLLLVFQTTPLLGSTSPFSVYFSFRCLPPLFLSTFPFAVYLHFFCLLLLLLSASPFSVYPDP